MRIRKVLFQCRKVIYLDCSKDDDNEVDVEQEWRELNKAAHEQERVRRCRR
jgi:hypothetical protein